MTTPTQTLPALTSPLFRVFEILPFDPAWPGVTTPAAPPAIPTPAAVLDQVAHTFGITVADLTSPCRRSYANSARYAAAYLISMWYPASSLAAIGEHLGGRSSSSVRYAIVRAQELMGSDPRYKAQVRALLPGSTPPPVPETTPMQALEAIAGHFGITVADLVGHSRRAPVATARHAAVHVLLARFPNLSLNDIGTLLGERDSSSIYHATRRVKELMQADPSYKAQIQALLPAETAA